MASSAKKDRVPPSSPPDRSDKGGTGGDVERLNEDAEWLSFLSEPELDLLISLRLLLMRSLLKSLISGRFELLGLSCLEHFKENAKRASIIPDNPQVLKLFDDCPLATTKASTSPAARIKGVSRSGSIIPVRKRSWKD